MNLAEQFNRDYLDVIKLLIGPERDVSSNLKLRDVRVLICSAHRDSLIAV